MLNKKERQVVVATIVGLFALSGILIIRLVPLQALRMVFGTVFMLFLPGFFLVEAAFPRVAPQESRQLDWIERMTFSFALSIATVPLVVYFLNKAGVAITARNIFLEVLGLIVALVVVRIVIERRRRHQNVVEKFG